MKVTKIIISQHMSCGRTDALFLPLNTYMNKEEFGLLGYNAM
jgi:hypothetical protein